jgi:hypothetical protein
MAPPAQAGGGGEVFVEFVVQGSVVKVTAIDPKTGTEAVVMGPAGAPRAALSDAAVRKLVYMLKKKSGA